MSPKHLAQPTSTQGSIGTGRLGFGNSTGHRCTRACNSVSPVKRLVSGNFATRFKTTARSAAESTWGLLSQLGKSAIELSELLSKRAVWTKCSAETTAPITLKHCYQCMVYREGSWIPKRKLSATNDSRPSSIDNWWLRLLSCKDSLLTNSYNTDKPEQDIEKWNAKHKNMPGFGFQVLIDCPLFLLARILDFKLSWLIEFQCLIIIDPWP